MSQEFISSFSVFQLEASVFILPFSSGLLPPEVAGGAVAGLNGRFRLYKYNVNDVFKPHTDGSWPGTAVVNGEGSSQAQMLHRFIAWFVFFVFFSPFCGEGAGEGPRSSAITTSPSRLLQRERCYNFRLERRVD